MIQLCKYLSYKKTYHFCILLFMHAILKFLPSLYSYTQKQHLKKNQTIQLVDLLSLV